MTKEEILSMKPGGELDSLIAEKIFGFKKHYYGETFDWVKEEKGEVVEWEPRYFQPSYKIEDAWKVLEKFPRFEIEKNGDGIWCVLMDDKWERFVGYGKTAPEAICKAALLAKEAKT